MKNILEKVEFIFVPFVNPDGYEVRIMIELSAFSKMCSILGAMTGCGERIDDRIRGQAV